MRRRENEIKLRPEFSSIGTFICESNIVKDRMPKIFTSNVILTKK